MKTYCNLEPGHKEFSASSHEEGMIHREAKKNLNQEALLGSLIWSVSEDNNI
jgi:hypothetical protein